jgi:hypothetical protein
VTRSAHADDARPDDPRGADGIRVDLERIVSSEESSGWFLDSAHFDSMHPTVLQSICRATPEARALARDRLASEVAVAGDPVTLFREDGDRMTTRVERALHLSRMRIALDRALETPCPFWIKPRYAYDGRQTDRNRFTLNAEIGTLLQLRWSASSFTIGASPSIRILPGYSFGHVAILAGAEFSAGPMLREDDSSKVVLNYFPAIPLVVRFRDGNWIYSIESGVVTNLRGDDTRLSYGVRGGFGIGLMPLRTRYFIPWAGAALFFEHFFAGAGRAATEFLRGGVRIGIIYDP